MKIVAVEAFALAVPMKPTTPATSWTAWLPKQVLVRVTADSGVTGLGEAFPYGAPLAVCNVIDEALRPLLLGQDPTRIEYLLDAMQRSAMNYGRRGLGIFAISGVEIALWDLVGKARGAPVYELLGGIVRDRLPAYASLPHYDAPSDAAEASTQAVAEGYRSLKLHQTDVESVQAARAAVGPDVAIMLDTNCPWSPPEAVAMARILEPYGLAWLEEPVWPPEDYDGLADVARQSPVPIASGENEATVYGFRDMIAKRAANILQPSVTKVGGIVEFRRIAALAMAAGLPIAPHSYYWGPGLAASMHLAATLREDTPVEMPMGEHAAPFMTRPIEVHDGWVSPSSRPGLGVEVDEDSLQRYRYDPRTAEPFLLH